MNRIIGAIVLIIAWYLYGQVSANCTTTRLFTVNGKLTTAKCATVDGKELCILREEGES